MSEEEFPFWDYQRDYGPLLKVLAQAGGQLAAQQDRLGLQWFRDHCIRLLDEAERLLEEHPAG